MLSASFAVGIALASSPSLVILDLAPESAALVERRLLGQTAGMNLDIRVRVGRCDVAAPCVRESSEVFLLFTPGALAPRRFSGASSGRAEMVAIALAAALEAEQEAPSEASAAPVEPEPQAAIFALALLGEGASDGLGWHPRLALRADWGRRWYVGADTWVGSGGGPSGPGLSLSLTRFGGAIRGGRWLGRGSVRGLVGVRVGASVLVRTTEGRTAQLRAASTSVEASLAMGLEVGLEWVLSRRWALVSTLRGDFVPRQVALVLEREGRAGLELGAAWPIHPVFGVGLRWFP